MRTGDEPGSQATGPDPSVSPAAPVSAPVGPTKAGQRASDKAARVHVRPVIDVLLTYGLLVTGTLLGVLVLRILGPHQAPDLIGRILGWMAGAAVGIPLLVLNSLLLHRLGLFVHAASHWQFATTRPVSDRVFNVLLAGFFGMDIDEYRKKHFAHHQRLGESDDPEDDYSRPFSWRGVLKLLTQRDSFRRPTTPERPRVRNWFRPTSKALHLSIVAGLSLSGNLAFAAMAWAAPVFFGLPFMVSVRNYCEHHSPSNGVPVSRNFKADLTAFFLGAAGFHLHGRHHDRPGVPYWQLGAEADPDARSYADTFLRLLQGDATR